jgi:hypothetical protein
MIHPIFQDSPDRYTGEVLSEAMVAGEYKYNFTPNDGSSVPQEGKFPPERAHITTVTAAFLAKDGQTVRTTMATGCSGEKDPKYRDIVGSYARTVAGYHDTDLGLELALQRLDSQNFNSRYGVLGSWCIESAQRSGKRLLVAHMVGVTEADRLIVDAICYPREFTVEIPLKIREILKDLAFAINDGVEEIDGEPISDEVRALVKDSMTMGSDSALLTALAPASLLPPLPQFRQIAKRALKTGKK